MLNFDCIQMDLVPYHRTNYFRWILNVVRFIDYVTNQTISIVVIAVHGFA